MWFEQLREREKRGGKTIDKNSFFKAIPRGSGRVLNASATTYFCLFVFSFCDICTLVKGIEITDAQVMRSDVITQRKVSL